MTAHDPALVERLAKALPVPLASQHVREWPEDERDYYRNDGWRDLAEAGRVLGLMRRAKAARTVLDLLAAEGWRQGVGRCQGLGPRGLPGALTPGMRAWCELADGHTGAHRERTAEWTELGPTCEALTTEVDRLRAALAEVIEVLRTSRGAGDAARVAREALDAPAGHTQPLGDGTGAP